MPAVIMDGKALGLKIRENLRLKCAQLDVVPSLAVILAGEDPASLSYVTAKEKALDEAGMKSHDIRLPENVNEDVLLSTINDINNNEKIHGILVQLPLPKHINEERVISAIDPKKDVDCFHPVSAGKMFLGSGGFLPCTPHGVLCLLREYNIPVSGSHVVIVGRSNIVGKPLANLLIRREFNATITVCHTGTHDITGFTKQADILIAAAGMPALIKKDMIKENAVVIDVGVNRVSDNSAKKGYRLCGDVDPDVAGKASFLTPVPGGVGPMTIAMLLQNVLEAAMLSKE
ncbi:MAG: bifunctional 5,10-methylene-tetrahydrofolate dehydrogenase/5,10-methylene-tetrahydrofolate cyclohydrolase [Treponema sp.]|nr:bifunctional 5,10-methylene-tetrahydrofolate dehydrogenase/5,10-methylene-tetrahydrofolate cyclohydrolase [Treponema sp.]MCL2272691.1 bifunctional 5,10-methylene-tetrahydrofolate dehydrogenase/5,10-methylene-tetrahydrofolate cyclohydrolase [Treponema sp.]